MTTNHLKADFVNKICLGASSLFAIFNEICVFGSGLYTDSFLKFVLETFSLHQIQLLLKSKKVICIE